MKLPPMPSVHLTPEERQLHIWAARACYWYARYDILKAVTLEAKSEAYHRSEDAFSRLHLLNATDVAMDGEPWTPSDDDAHKDLFDAETLEILLTPSPDELPPPAPLLLE